MNDVPDSEIVYPCQLVLLAMGFLGPEAEMLDSLNVGLDPRTNIKTEPGAEDLISFKHLNCSKGTCLCNTSWIFLPDLGWYFPAFDLRLKGFLWMLVTSLQPQNKDQLSKQTWQDYFWLCQDLSLLIDHLNLRVTSNSSSPFAFITQIQAGIMTILIWNISYIVTWILIIKLII